MVALAFHCERACRVVTAWPAVVVPAVVTALLVRVDAKLVGPYFAMSELVSASDSIDARYFYQPGTLRNALLRRMSYPLLLGLVLSWTVTMPSWEIAIVGAIAAGLLLWPVLFHGLPHGVSRRDWEVPGLYVGFVGSYAGFAAIGHLVRNLLEYVAEGDVRRWLTDQLLSAFVMSLITLFLLGFYRSMYRRLIRKVDKRAADQRTQ